MLDRHACFQFSIACKKANNTNNATHYVKVGKKRRESSKRNYYIISPRVIIKAKPIKCPSLGVYVPVCTFLSILSRVVSQIAATGCQELQAKAMQLPLMNFKSGLVVSSVSFLACVYVLDSFMIAFIT